MDDGGGGDAAYVRFSMYDGRLRLQRALRGDAKRMQSRILKTMRGRSSRATGGGGDAAYVRFSMDDGRLRSERAGRGGLWINKAVQNIVTACLPDGDLVQTKFTRQKITGEKGAGASTDNRRHILHPLIHESLL